MFYFITGPLKWNNIRKHCTQWLAHHTKSKYPCKHCPTSKLFHDYLTLEIVEWKKKDYAGTMCWMHIARLLFKKSWKYVITSGRFGLSDRMKNVITLAVPGIIVRMAKRRCIAVVVKNVSMIIKLIELEFFMQYFANPTNALQVKWNFVSVKSESPSTEWLYSFVCSFRSRLVLTYCPHIAIRGKRNFVPRLTIRANLPFTVFIKDIVVNDCDQIIESVVDQQVFPYCVVNAALPSVTKEIEAKFYMAVYQLYGVINTTTFV